MTTVEPSESSRGRKITVEQWEAHRPLIVRLFIDEGRTLRETMKVLEEQCNFYATARQYKTKFPGIWDLPPKKLDKHQYNAMWTVMTALSRRLRTRSISIATFNGAGPKSHTYQTISKQLKRPSQSGPNGFSEMSLDEAIHILLSRKTSFRVYCVDAEISLKDFLQSTREADWWAPYPQFSPQVESASPSSSPPHSPISDSGIVSRNAGVGDAGARRHSMTLMYPPRAAGILMSLDRTSPGRCSRCPESSAHDDYECDTEFASMASGVMRMSLSSNQTATSISHKALVSQWAAPTVLKALSGGLGHQKDLASYLNDSGESLRAILDTIDDNKFLLPCLNWTVCVLFYNCRQQQLSECVQQAAQVIAAGKSANSVLLLPFQFISASLRKDDAVMQSIGSQFESSYTQVRACFGEQHPNTIVYFYYWTWYTAWIQKDHAIIEGNLEKILPTLQKMLGVHSTLTINCMFMLASHCITQGNYWKAIGVLRKALDQISPAARHMEAYRLCILHVLASAETKVGTIWELEMAESHLREVLAGRLDLFGLGHHNEAAYDYVWECIFDLRDVLNGLGRQHEAHEIFRYHKAKYQEEHRTWWVERGWTPPAEAESSGDQT